MTRLFSSLKRSLQRSLRIIKILTIEYLREPTALLWTGIAPCIMFIFSMHQFKYATVAHSSYATSAAWFYSYMSASVAFFGFSFYLIGRRESGFIRSFIYQKSAVRLFLASHFVSYSLLSLFYFTLFYLATKPFFGSYSPSEYFYLAGCFYTSYLIFSCLGLAIAALPIKFGTASTAFSLLSFWMLLSGYLGATTTLDRGASLSEVNPLSISMQIFSGELPLAHSFIVACLALLSGSFLTTKKLRTQPVWSRY